MRMFGKTAVTLLAILLVGCASNRPNVSALDQSRPDNISQTQPRFFVETFNIANPNDFEKSIMEIFPVIPVSEFIFVKYDNGFQARYNIEFLIFNSKNDSLLSYASYDGTTNTMTDYSKTKNPYSYTGGVLPIQGKGEYQLTIRITDKFTTKNISQITIPIHMRNVHTGVLSLSDPLMFETVAEGKKFFTDLLVSTTDKKQTTVPPLNSQTIDPTLPASIVFEVYYAQPYTDSDKDKQVVITYNLYSGENAVMEGEQTFKIDPDTRRQTIGFNFAPENVKNGTYQLRLQASIQDTSTGMVEKNSHAVSKKIRLYSPIPQTNVELDELIANLQYVMDPPSHKVIKKMKNAKDKEKQTLYDKFWEKRSEYEMAQHYVRVAYANEHYTQISDVRKMVCIRYGIPVQPEARKEPLYINTQYGDVNFEIWEYYNLDAADPFYFWPTQTYYTNKTFIFVDEYGFETFSFGMGMEYSRLSFHNQREFDYYD